MASRTNIAAALFAATAALVAGIWALQSFSGPKPGAILKADDPQTVALGKQVYSENCASCHGENLEGQENWKSPGPDGSLPAPPHDETGHTWHHTDDVLFEITKFGLVKFATLKDYKSNMPAYDGDLPDDEIIAVLSYIKSSWPEQTQRRHDRMNAQNAKAVKK